MPRVSVIVPARDAASTLQAALDSVAAQRYRDWELIVVDDGSTDATAEIAARCRDAVVIRHDAPAGPAGARNSAAEGARGELLALLDADDVYREDYLERLVALYDRHGGRAGIVGCDAAYCDADGEPLAERWSDRVPLPPSIGLTQLLRENPLQSKVLLARDALEAAGGFDVELHRAEDYDLWLRVAERGFAIAVDPEPLVVLRLRPDSLSADTERLASATAEVYDRALRRGNLDRRQRRIARRQRRLQRLVAARARPASGAERLRVNAVGALVVLEHPERWGHWLRRGVRRTTSVRGGN